jgi:hypothetical protein
VTPEHVDDLVSKARQSSSMKANPITLTDAELREAMGAAL